MHLRMHTGLSTNIQHYRMDIPLDILIQLHYHETMSNDQTTITLEAMQQMFRESEERLENRLMEKFEPEFLNIYRKISDLEGLFRFLNQSILGIRSDINILKREAIQTNKRLDNLDIRIDGLETSMNKQFKTLANEMIKYTDGASSYCHKELDNHETRIIRLEQDTPILLRDT